jgi:hypothetical protein
MWFLYFVSFLLRFWLGKSFKNGFKQQMNVDDVIPKSLKRCYSKIVNTMLFQNFNNDVNPKTGKR